MNYENANAISFEKNFMINEELPNIEIDVLPQEILMKLKRIFASNISELTSLSQYSYQHFILSAEPKLSNVSKAMEIISETEMRHFELIAKILVKCGIDPKSCVYIDANPNVCDYWKASSVDYTKNIVKMIEQDIKLENYAIEDYNQVIKITNDENLKDIIKRILEDEYSHINYFNAIYEALMNR